jgi:hypothetical protein
MAAILLVAAVAGAQLLSQTAATSDRLIDKVQPARAEALRLQTALVGQESGVRGSALTGEAEFLQPYTEGVRLENTYARTMSGLISHDQQLTEDLRRLREAAADWRRHCAKPLITVGEAGPAREREPVNMEEGRRAFDHIRTQTGCWLWTGSCNGEGQSGYGQVSCEGRTQLVHHVVFRLLVGEVPEGFQVRHADPWGRHFTLCRNPDHLEAVPKREALRRRGGESARARGTHCPHGHAYPPENSYLDPRGFRQCRTCRAERGTSRRVPRAV